MMENWGISSQSREVDEGVLKNYSDRSPGLRETLRNATEKVASMWESVKATLCDDPDEEFVAYDLENSRVDPNPETIEDWLNQFGLPGLLLRLDKSLEEVKRNKKEKESHEQLSESVDKDLRRLSLRVHPDHAGNHEWQSALNAIRKVLKTLTAVFLENIFIDYKYEYFSRLDINVLVNENEINNIIQAMFYKISLLSETKRMNIIGEIRKFLTESEICMKSYFECHKSYLEGRKRNFEGHKSNFEKHRDYALYHLQKNIEGYKKLEKECNILIEECSKEHNSMRVSVENVVRQSLSESSILRSLECIARRSFQGKFEIFPVNRPMDEYYVLPFVDYVNLLSLCNFLLQSKCLRFSFNIEKHGFSHNIEDYRLFSRACVLASDIYNVKRGHLKTKTTSVNVYQNELHKVLKEIFPVLQMKYKVEAYGEGKSNREEMYEKLLTLKKFLGDLQEKEKGLEERLSRYKMEEKESSESVVNDRRDMEENFKVGMKKQDKESEENSSKEELSDFASTEEKWSIITHSDVEFGEDCVNLAYLN